MSTIILFYAFKICDTIYLRRYCRRPSRRNPRWFFLCPRRGEPMPYKPKRPCAYPGCGRLADREQYCTEHQRVVNNHYDKYERDPESNKRYGRVWKRIRYQYIRMHPLCEECRNQGRLTPAQEVHHIVPLSRGGGNETENLMSLCKSCHSRISVETGDRWG